MIYLAQLYIIACTLFLAGHDSTSYLLKSGGTNIGPLLFQRIKRWHRDGSIIFFLCCLPLVYFIGWQIIIAALLIRLSFFDLAFNVWSELPIERLGTTAFTDRLFANIFGNSGALRKSLLFLVLLVLLNILNKLFL